jgi:hypothetical protein
MIGGASCCSGATPYPTPVMSLDFLATSGWRVDDEPDRTVSKRPPKLGGITCERERMAGRSRHTRSCAASSAAYLAHSRTNKVKTGKVFPVEIEGITKTVAEG